PLRRIRRCLWRWPRVRDSRRRRGFSRVFLSGRGVGGRLPDADEADKRKLTDPENRFSVHRDSPDAIRGEPTDVSVAGNSHIARQLSLPDEAPRGYSRPYASALYQLLCHNAQARRGRFPLLSATAAMVMSAQDGTPLTAREQVEYTALRATIRERGTA